MMENKKENSAGYVAEKDVGEGYLPSRSSGIYVPFRSSGSRGGFPYTKIMMLSHREAGEAFPTSFVAEKEAAGFAVGRAFRLAEKKSDWKIEKEG